MITADLSNEFYPVPKQKKTEKNKSRPIKKKSNKLAKLERNRFSIITKDLEHCYICKQEKWELHEVFGGSNRQTSMKYGLVIPVCRKCHNLIPNNETLMENLYKVAKKEFKKHYKSENFIEIFRKKLFIGGKEMRRFLQAIIIIASILLGAYVGIYLMLIGGIVQIVNGINPLNGLEIAIGICRVIFCEIAGVIPIAGISIAGIIED